MTMKQHKHRSATCRCGKVEFETAGAPIVTVACYCSSCQEAGSRFEQLPAAPPVLNADGGTGFLLYRKDRVRCAHGQDHLEEHRLKPDATSRRVVTTCCNSAMFLEFKGGHWLSMYRNRFTTEVPRLEMRTMTKDRRAGVTLANDVPNLNTHSGMFMFKLLATWIAMGFRSPTITWGKAKP